MEIVHLLATILPSYNSLPPRSQNGGMATLAAGGLMNSDVIKSFRKVDEMLRWTPCVVALFVVCAPGCVPPVG